MAEHVQLGENFGVNVVRGSESQKDFECQRCGWCCKQVNINISYSDILRWSKEKRLDILSEIEYVEHDDPKKRGFYIIKTLLDPKQACPFLVEENPPTCSIHDTEPRACREFPQAHSEGEKEKIECPARKSFHSDDEEVSKLKKEQALDFVIAEDRKEKLIRILAIARDVLEGQRILKAFGEDPTETLKVTTMGSERTAWTEVGTLHLQEQDQPTHYMWTTTKKAEHGDWDFANTAHSSDTFNTCTLYVYSQNASARELSAFIWDGTDWTEYVMTHPTSWGWHSIDVTFKIDSWTKVDGCKLYIKQPNQADRSDVDAAYLLIDYTEAGATTGSFLTESVTVTDTWKEEHVEYLVESFLSETVTATDTWEEQDLYTHDSFLSESATAADTWKQQFIEAAGETFNSFLTETITATDTWKHTFNDVVGKTWTNGNTTGIWNDADNWSPAGVPANNHDVDFTSGYTDSCSIDVTTANLRSFEMQTGYTGTVSLNANTLYVEYLADNSDFTGTQGTLNAGTGLIKVSGDWDSSSATFTFTRGTSTVELTGTGLLRAIANSTNAFNNLKCAASGKETSMTTYIRTQGVLTMQGGTLDDNSGAQHLELHGNELNRLVLNGTLGGTIRTYYRGANVNYNVAGGTYPHQLVMSSESMTATLQGAVTLGQALFVEGAWGSHTHKLVSGGHALTTTSITLGINATTKYGFLECGASAIDVGSVNIYETGSYIDFGTSTWSISGNYTSESVSASHDDGASVVTFDGSPTQTLTSADTTRAEFYDMKITNGTTVQLASNFKIGHGFGDGADNGTVDMGGAYIFYVGGDWDSSSASLVFTRQTGTVYLNGTGNVTVRDTLTNAFHHLNCGISGATTTIMNHIGVYGTLAVGTGTLARSGAQYAYLRNATTPLTNSGTITAHIAYVQTSAVTALGTTYGGNLWITPTDAVVVTLGGAASISGDLYVYNTTVGNTVTLKTNGFQLDVTGDTKIGHVDTTKFGILDCDAANINVASINIYGASCYLLLDTSIWTVSGNWTNESTSANWDEGTSVIEFDGDSTQTIANNGKEFYDLKYSGTGQKDFTESFTTHDVRALNDVTMKITASGPIWRLENPAEVYADAGYTLTLRSSDDINDWNMNSLTPTVVATRVDVKNSSAVSGNWINAMRAGTVDSGSNSNWEFGNRFLSEDVTAADTWLHNVPPAGDTFPSFLTENVGISDTWKEELWKGYSQYLSESVSVTDNWYHQHLEYVIASFISESVTASDTWKEEALYTYLQALTESVSVSDTWKQETLLLFKQYLSEGVSVSDDWFQQHLEYVVTRYLSESVSVSDDWKQELWHTFLSYLTETVGVSDDWICTTAKRYERRLSESVSVADAWLHEHIEAVFSQFLSEDVSVSDTWKEETIKIFKKHITEGITISDDWVQEQIEYLAGSYITEAVSVTDAWRQEALHVFSSYLTEGITGTDAWKQELLRTISRTLSESVIATDTWKQEYIEVYLYERHLSESVTISDAVLSVKETAEFTSRVARLVAIIGAD